MKPHEIRQLITQTIHEYKKDKISHLAAALAYYMVFSIGPILLIALTLLGWFYNPSDLQQKLFSLVWTVTGSAEAAGAVQILVTGFADDLGSGISATIFGFIALLFTATRVFVQLQDALNTVWGVRENLSPGPLVIIKERLSAFLLVLGIGVLLLLFTVLSTVIPVLNGFGTSENIRSGVIWELIKFFGSLAVITVLFATIFKVVPNANVHSKEALLGAFFTALTFVIGQTLLGIYFGMKSFSVYGGFAALILFMFWVYVSAQILLFGAEFTQVYARLHGTKISSKSRKTFLAGKEQSEVQEMLKKTIRGTGAKPFEKTCEGNASDQTFIDKRNP
jgi:membrane protein